MIYFDNAATSRFKPHSAVRAFLKEVEHSANGGRSGHSDAVRTAIEIADAREKIQHLLNADNVVFTKNCTEALNLAIFGTVKDGGHVVTTVNEHNSVLRPLYFLAKEKRIRLSVVNPDAFGIINPYHVAKLICRDTCLVAVGAASNVTGAVLDVAAVGKACVEHDVPLLVDGAQAVPHIQYNMAELGISYLACPGHKGLHGFQGTGFLAIRSDTVPKPLIFGGTGTNSDSVYQPISLPEALEAGTLASPAIIALGKAVEWTERNRKKILKKTSAINGILLYGLKNMKGVTVYTPDGSTLGVVAFNVGKKPSTEVGDILNERFGIAVRTGLHCAPLIHNHLGTLERGAVRASIGYNNTEKDAEKLLNAVEYLLKT